MFKCVTFITKSLFISKYIKSLNLFLDCSRILLSQSGDISSDNYPNKYSPNTDCLYIITPTKWVYKIQINDIQMADVDDYLEVSTCTSIY